MSQDIFNKFEALFREMESGQHPNVEKFVHEALLILNSLREKMVQGTDEERAKALELAQRMQKMLEQRAEKAMHETGMNAQQLEEFLSKRSNFTDEQWNSFQKARNEMVDYQKETLNQTMSEVSRATQRSKESGKEGGGAKPPSQGPKKRPRLQA